VLATKKNASFRLKILGEILYDSISFNFMDMLKVVTRVTDSVDDKRGLPLYNDFLSVHTKSSSL
jgi:hypothetical protein